LCQYALVAPSPRVTIIIPTYNWSSVLRYSVGSVLRQTFTDFELLVVGDGCTDDSADVVASFNDPRVRWINLPQNSRHQSAPNNEGLRQARAELIAYLGHDDLWLPHHLESLVSALDAANGDVAYSMSINVAADGSVSPSIACLAEGIVASPLCVIHRRRVTEEIGGWRNYRELKIGPDVELWQRMYAAGYRFTAVPRLTGIKFPGSLRRDVYKNRPCHEQAAWWARIESEPDFEPTQLASLIAGDGVLRGVRYRTLVLNLVHETKERIRRRLSMPWLGFTYNHGGIDALRRYKGL
jgi:glycosyltransferase involved in cell wall biosynthesis